jgi:1-acyl-sn-glycerol-3-phosphate acyltransferase
MKQVSGLILKLTGWRVNVPPEFRLDKAVVVMAPHTSMRDFWIGRLAYWYLGMKVKFIIKKELFFFPLGIFIKAMGGIPVNRQNSGNLKDQIVEIFSEKEHLVLTITPEGTRKLNYNWKRGFYYIAVKANVPILLGYVDYKKKTGGIGKLVTPSGNYEEDLGIIQDFYMDITARFPENFNLSPQNRKKKRD